MVYVIAQISDVHIGGHSPGSGDRFSIAINEINTMTRTPDLVLLTGDLTEHGAPNEWDELCVRLQDLKAPWEAMAGNHDRKIAALAGHRAINAGPLRLVLLDTSNDIFSEEDALWLDKELTAHSDAPTIVAVHQPPFETGIWWMDCVGLNGSNVLETVVRKHRQVIKVLSGHVHRLIQTNWDHCSLWVCPSTSVSIAIDLDANHDPAETAENPTFSLHVFTGRGIVSHLVPVGTAAKRTSIADSAPDFVAWARNVQATRSTGFS
jgi:3',5'-cyclic-AMP phosphodiesterase